MTLIAALSLFGLLVLAAVVATALSVRSDGYGGSPRPPQQPWGVGDLPSTPYRDARRSPRSW